jgi:hypothetical protein
VPAIHLFPASILTTKRENETEEDEEDKDDESDPN